MYSNDVQLYFHYHRPPSYVVFLSGHVMRREEHYVGRRAMVMKVQGRRERGRPKTKRRWLDKVKDDIKETVADDVYDSATWRHNYVFVH